MDRFERIFVCDGISFCIYLHSNMDRFERIFANYLNVKASAIYIPIWIDLKAEIMRK